MAEHNETGRMGEEMARRYLTERDYAILECNWRCGKNEADIIAYKDATIIFVEVKTRSNTGHGEPESFVDRKKQQAYIRLANKYVIDNKRSEEVRFDIIAITLSSQETKIEHFENAYNAISAKFRS